MIPRFARINNLGKAKAFWNKKRVPPHLWKHSILYWVVRSFSKFRQGCVFRKRYERYIRIFHRGLLCSKQRNCLPTFCVPFYPIKIRYPQARRIRGMTLPCRSYQKSSCRDFTRQWDLQDRRICSAGSRQNPAPPFQ